MTDNTRRGSCHNTIGRNTGNHNRVSSNYYIITNHYTTQNTRPRRNIYVITNNRNSLRIKLSPNSYTLPNYNSITYFRLCMKHNADPPVRKPTPPPNHRTKRNHRIKKKKNQRLAQRRQKRDFLFIKIITNTI